MFLSCSLQFRVQKSKWCQIFLPYYMKERPEKNTNLGGSQNYTAMTMGAVIAIVNGAIHKTTSTTIHYTEHDANEYSIAYEQTGTNKAAGIDLNSQKTLM